ncbi:hypothetical protein BDP27DRAFT_1294856 [Rhodocollybia butyracea]|uniref:Uncharacterized protein n=1 Tax=Rhodocollybia butyracea TaxID=206335 RepID=A0A9P5PRI7_9AGAR|nr:hypothetical protein BDP27DRAFT_1294856 [Rhodocollybia butyracea]
MSSFISQLVSLFNDSSLEQAHAIVILYHSVGIVAQTFVYGIYTCLMPISTFVMLKTGLQTPIRKFLLGMTIFMYSISSVHWILSVVNIIQNIQFWFLSSNPDKNPPSLIPLFSALILVNYVLTDGVVVWRAWVLCSDSSTGALRIPMGLLCGLLMSVAATIIIRIILTSPAGNDAKLNAILARIIDASQVANLVLSLLTNISSTSIVGLKAWKYRRDIKNDFEHAGKQTKANKILVLLVESGVLYIFSGIMVLAASLVRLPNGTLGDIYTPVNFQIAGIYPLVVLLLVNQDSSLKKTVFASTIPNSMPQPREESHLESMRFGIVETVGTMEDYTGSDTESDYELSLKPHAHGRRPSRFRFSGQSKPLPDTPGDLKISDGATNV